ncbi:toprim domain-containing protein [Thermoactinomyces sp. DSM 45892]|uniref:toprim domain-containing protein n=1 Tax=Thermoactinomyces sp. DSM 45892 TaxID=1882753 RepID=UPI00089A3AE3|nr:toprim domain-containing protein [Thermoactinomyces sp. DSM 45892]SDX93664.1 DNA gyrase subunit B [Thermoactinomyces sp. DSM 45892]
MSHTYTSDSIQSLGILGGVRAKPASIGLESHNHTFLEILGNSIDEHRAGWGKEIIVTKHVDGSVTVRDFGRGVPMDQNRVGDWSYKKVFDELWAGGKYQNNEEDGGSYQYSLGTNGVGATGTNYTSDFFQVTVHASSGKVYQVEYEKGVETSDGIQICKNEGKIAIGTTITWRPSAEVFRGKSEIDDDFIITTLQDQAIVNGGLKFLFKNEQLEEEQVFYFQDGVKDYIRSISSEEHSLTDVVKWTTEQKGRDNENDKDYKIKADIYFSFNRETSFSRYYHNSSWLENGGTPEDFVKNSFTFVLDKFLKDQNLYTKGEKKISFDDVEDSLMIVTSTYSTISLFTDQTKKKIGSDFMKRVITTWLREQLEVYLVENPQEAKLILSQVLVNKRSREKAEKTRLDVRKKLAGTVNNLTARIDGFINCKSKDASKTELYIVEGKSALGSTKQGRDAEFQAIYALRGKILNCLKADYDKIFRNEIIVDLLKILGCGIEVKSKHAKNLNTFDLNNLRWSKLIICTDADVDGFHIRTLLLTTIYRLMPTLLDEGRVFIAESPLYEITNQNKSYFAYSDREKEEIVSTLKGNVLIQRSKGLGENTAEMMWETTMNPETRKLVQVMKDDVEQTQGYFEMFLGDDLVSRKQYIEENLSFYIEDGLT